MPNQSSFHKLLAISPYIEVAVRHFYWRNANLLARFKPGKKKTSTAKPLAIASAQPVDFAKVTQQLKNFGVEPGTLAVVHSAYASLKPTGLKPIQIIDELLALIGDTGTLAMPGMPKFENDLAGEDYLHKSIDDLVFEYNVQTTPIKTGVLPTVLFSKPSAQRSLFPINTMVALGPLAHKMMEHNFESSDPLPCGQGSTWEFCYRNDALIIGLGVDLTHSLTMIHVAEDVLDKQWPVPNWYRKKRFTIVEGNSRKEIVLRERDPKWGTLHFAERTLCKDLIQEGIMKSAIVDGVIIEVMKAKDLIAFLNSKNKNGYPYYGVGKYISRKSNS